MIAKELFLGWAIAAACLIEVRHVIVRTNQNQLQSTKSVFRLVCAVLLPPLYLDRLAASVYPAWGGDA